MIELSAEFLSRLQFAFVISFHIIFPSFTIGLASFLVVIEALWLKTKLPVYSEIYSFLIKIFAVVFGMGVVTGIVMQGNCMKFSECQNRLNMVNNKEQMNKEKIDEALRSD
ncbi:MAG: cytochrome bd-type quinol oxidase subunit 1, partial [Candidatus Midichloriaceae bacterium]